MERPTRTLILFVTSTAYAAGLGCSLLVPVDDYASGGAGSVASTSAPSSATGSGGNAGSSSAGGSGGGGTGGASDECPASCRGFTDDFEDGNAAPNWQVVDNSQSVLAETGGELVITIISGYAGYKSSSKYELTNCCVLCGIVQGANPMGGGQVRLRAAVDTNNFVEFLQNGDKLDVRSQTGGPPADAQGSETYSATKHRWWRIRESAGVVHWETSESGKAPWNEMGKTSTPFSASALTIELSANDFGARPYGEAHFDNFNLLPP